MKFELKTILITVFVGLAAIAVWQIFFHATSVENEEAGLQHPIGDVAYLEILPKSPVQKIRYRYRTFTLDENNRFIVNHSRLINSTTKTYNKRKGYECPITEYSYSYNDKYMNYNTKLSVIRSKEYDAKGRLISISKHIKTESYKYDKNNRIIELNIIYKNGNTERKTFKYNDQGQLISEDIYRDGEVYRKIRYTNIKVDSHGNWISRVSSYSGRESRKITYHE